MPERVYPIGRLDKNSEGLLSFSLNDGNFVNDIMQSSSIISLRSYRYMKRSDINDEQLIKLVSGVEIVGKMTEECSVVVPRTNSLAGKKLQMTMSMRAR